MQQTMRLFVTQRWPAPEKLLTRSGRQRPPDQTRSGFFFVAGPQEKAPPTGRGKGGFRHWSGRAREIARPVALPTVGRRARLFPDFNPPRSAPATADKPNAQRAPNEVKSSASSESIFWAAVAKMPRSNSKPEERRCR